MAKRIFDADTMQDFNVVYAGIGRGGDVVLAATIDE